jgi:hypothetical protein
VVAVRKGFQHVHHGQTNPATLLRPEPGVEQLQAGFRPVPATKPDRSAAQQIADDDPVGMPLADRDLVDADHQRRWAAHPAQLLAHILLVQVLDRLPIQIQFFGDGLDGRVSTASADVICEPFRVERIVRQPIQLFALHAAVRATHAPDLELQIDLQQAAGQIARHPRASIVKAARQRSTLAAGCFFRRRRRQTIRAFGAPKIPCTSANGTKPAKRYASRNCRLPFAMRSLKQVSGP